MSEKDDETISNLIASEYRAGSEIQERISKYGGVELKNVQIEFEPTESSHFMSANLQGDMSRESVVETITDELPLMREGRYWFIVLGKSIYPPGIRVSPASVDRNTREQY